MYTIVVRPKASQGNNNVLYYFQGYAHGTVLLTDNQDLAAVINEDDVERLLESLRKKSDHIYDRLFSDRPANWTPFRLRQSKVKLVPQGPGLKTRISKEKQNQAVERYKQYRRT